jgi:glutamate-1-semialdehyde 2,1-aminomutase
VFDECTSGFRQVLGGLHLVYGVEPDIATFGKTLGNGYAINAVIGRAAVMQAANRTFISSTFWTERIGPAAALAALAAMAEEDAPARIHSVGIEVRAQWAALAQNHGLAIDVSGIPAVSALTLRGRETDTIKTFVASHLLEKGFLATTAFYSGIPHSQAVLHDYSEALDSAFRVIRDRSDGEISDLLPGGTARSGFRRLS